MAVSPADPQQVAEALLAYVAGHLDVEGMVYLHEPARIGRGMDTHIYAFQLNAEGLGPKWSASLVLRLYTSPGQAEKAEKEAKVQTFAAQQGYPAVEPLLVDGDADGIGLPIMIMPHVGGAPMLELISSNPLRAGTVLRKMANLQVLLHALPALGCDLPKEPPLVERKLAELRRDATGDPAQEEALAWLVAKKARVVQEEKVLCHGDFHPLNILVEEDGSTHILDWSDAELGDRHYDVARSALMFWIAPIIAESTVERVALRLARGYLQRSYLHAYREQVSLSDERLTYWRALHAFGGWQLVSRLNDPSGDLADVAREDSVARLPEGLGEQLRKLFWKLAKSA